MLKTKSKLFGREFYVLVSLKRSVRLKWIKKPSEKTIKCAEMSQVSLFHVSQSISKFFSIFFYFQKVHKSLEPSRMRRIGK